MSQNTYDRSRYDAGWRLVLMILVGTIAGVGTGVWGHWADAPAIGWAAAAGTFLLVTGVTLSRIPPEETGAHATREDGSRTASHLLVTAATIASFGAVALLLLDAGPATGGAKIAIIAIAVGTAALSWVLTHTLFALRYAALYYAEGGGIDFNQNQPPDYGDFLYLAFTMGMAYQVSDTAVGSRRIRGVVLRHGLLSYVMGALVLATTVNLVSGLVQ
jgi:uncharacterized membrane protein